MVDLMATSTGYDEPENFEDGELPEDGEICDDDDEPMRGTTEPSQSSPSQNVPIIDQSAVSGTSPSSTKASRTPRETMGMAEDGVKPSPSTWASKLAAAGEKIGDVFGYGAEDKDYRFEDEPSGDFDYRQGGGHVGRRRRHSPSQDEWDPRAPKRPYGGRGFRGFRPKPRWATEHQICKFFREGYCRDGDNCAYSHQAEDSLRRPELCKFYQQGFCKKGLTCLLLHGEFPCKAFHKGECSRDPCHFSHVPLTDYTRPLFERMCQEDEMYASRGLGNHHMAPMKRRVLLPQGPAGPQQVVPPPTSTAPAIHAAIPQQPTNGGPLAPPSVVVPTLGGAVGPTPPPFPAMPPRLPYYAPAAVSSPRFDDKGPAVPTTAPMTAAQPAVNAVPSAQFNISQMLAQIAGDPIVDEESPASPPMCSGAGDGAMVRQIPEGNVVAWRLIAVEAPPAYSGINPGLSVTSQDPRMNRVISSQFDAVSSLIAATPQATADSPASRTDVRFRSEERRSSDDRPRASSWMPQMA
ncbi:Zinc finger domain containing protein [Trichostrongylus colubriformis]|uniref:Zinc finger domain containing protein n=1 Tax=Trichostrongylus colubriformis TaxID=6319 RepID=A0AAN8FWG6_TRICO